MIKIDKQRVLEANNIVDVIGSYIPLKRRGHNYMALCPFHKEKTPSFTVNEELGIFKCFGCGKGGNVITFVMEYEKISYFEALKLLADRAGIKYQDVKSNKKIDNLYKIYQLANEYYKENIKNFGTNVYSYLEKRKIGKETAKKFELGYALDSYEGLKNYLLKNNISPKLLLSTGLFLEKNSHIYDLFRNRLMIPIHSHSGRIVAFGGRVLDNTKTSKYINSPTTQIYHKGEELYGFYKTKRDILSEKKIIIVEGYLDFLRLYEEGIRNIVASLGTSLTDKQIDLAARYVKKFVILYDGDNPGQKASLKAALSIAKKGYDVKIVTLPSDEDPDSFIINYGKEKLIELIENAANLIDFVYNLSDITGQQKLQMLIETASEIYDLVNKELFIKDISERFGISEKAIKSKIKTGNKIQKSTVGKKEPYEEKDLLYFTLLSKKNYKKVAQEIDSSYFLSIKLGLLYEKIGDMYKKSQNILSDLDEFEEEQRNLISELMVDEKEVDIDKLLSSIKLRKLKKELKQINEELRKVGINQNLLQKRKEIIEKMNQLNRHGGVVSKTLY
jgi:DNA primase